MVLGLSWLDGQEALRIFQTELSADRHLKTRIAALWALGRFFRKYEAPRANDGEPEEGVQKALDQVNQLLDSEDINIRCAALACLGKAGDRRLLNRFLSILEESDPKERCVTQEIDVPNRRPELIYRESSLRFRALEAMAYITRGNEAAKEALKRILGDNNFFENDDGDTLRKQVQDLLNRAESAQ